MGELARPQNKIEQYVNHYGILPDTELEALDINLEQLEKLLPEQKEWVIYGNSIPGAFAFAASKICRRAERSIVVAQEKSIIQAVTLKYVNRLSDYLFLIGRHQDWYN